MADDSLISRDITDVPIVSSGLDRPENKDLKQAFAEWNPEPVKEEEPPSAPVERPQEEELVEAKVSEGETRAAIKPETDVQESPAEELPKAKRSFEKEVSRAPSEEEIREVTDPKPKVDADSFEAMELRPDAPENQKSQFRQLKEITQKFSAEAKAYRAKIAPLLKEYGLGELPDNPADVEKTLEQFQTKLRDRPAIDPAVAQELETYRILTRNSEVQRSLSFDRDFVKPVNNAFADLVTDLASAIPGDPAGMRQWVEQVLANKPELINAAWVEEHLAKVPDGLARERLRSKAGNLSGLLQNKTRTQSELVANGDLYHQWQRDVEAKAQKQYEEQYRNEFQTMVMDESTKLLAEHEFEDIRLLREAAKRGDNAELVKESQRLEDAFKEHLTKINMGPRAQTGIIMRNLMLERKLENYKALEAENIRLRKETQSRNKLRGHELQPHRGTASAKATVEKPRLSAAKQPNWDDL